MLFLIVSQTSFQGGFCHLVQIQYFKLSRDFSLVEMYNSNPYTLSNLGLSSFRLTYPVISTSNLVFMAIELHILICCTLQKLVEFLQKKFVPIYFHVAWWQLFTRLFKIYILDYFNCQQTSHGICGVWMCATSILISDKVHCAVMLK